LNVLILFVFVETNRQLIGMYVYGQTELGIWLTNFDLVNHCFGSTEC